MSRNAWDADLYDGKHAFVFGFGQDLVSLLAPQPGERVLDLGAGTGHLTAAIAAAGATVVGIDASPEMVAAARRQHPGLEFFEGDARSFPRPGPFDAVFSNATLHWIPDATAVARNVAAHLRPGGRFVAEFGGHGNIAHIIAGLGQAAEEVAGVRISNPWYFPMVGAYAGLLERCGLEVRFAQLFDRPTRLDEGERGMQNWLAMFAGPVLGQVPESRRAAVIRRAEELMRPELFRDGAWLADYRRLRVAAYRTEGGAPEP